MKKVGTLLVCIAVAGLALSAPVSAKAVARVDGKPLDQADVDYLTTKVLKYPKGREKAALQQAINNRLLYNKAKKDYPELVADVGRAVELLLARDYLAPYQSKIALPKAEKAVTDKLVAEKAGKPEDMINLRQITFVDRKTADEVLPQLRSGALDFGEAAKKYSKGLTGPQGGHVGGIYRSATDLYSKETMDLLFTTPLNRVTDVVDTKLGSAVFLVTERITAAQWAKMTSAQIRKDLVKAKAAEIVWKDVEALGEKKKYKLLLDAASAGTSKPDLGQVVIDWAGKKYTVEDVMARSGGGEVHGAKDVLTIAENAWRDLALQELYVKAKGKLPDHAMKERVLAENFTARKLLNRITADLKVEEADVAAYMAAHPEEFELPDRVEVSVIYVKTEQRLKQVQGLLAEGKDFAEVARGFSQDKPSAENGGRVGLVPVQGAAGVKPEVGKVSEPVYEAEGERKGWSIFKTHDFQPARKVTLAELDAQTLGTVKAKLMAEKREKVILPYLAAVRKAAKVEIL